MRIFPAVLIALPALFAATTGFGQMGMMQRGGMMNMSTVRHQYARQHGIDASYARLSNPVQRTPANLAEGGRLYEQNCAVCHGATGRGDGDAGKNLNPPPANIAATTHMPMGSDPYLYWTIAEGGVPVKSAMPPYKTALKADAIWKIILYVRGL